jgi:aldose 1-epimerase
MPFEIQVDASQEYPIILLKDTLTNCQATIYSFGGILNAFSLPVNGISQNIIAGFESVADAKLQITNGFKSAKLAPFVCRLWEGKYSFNNQSYQIEKFYMGNHAIHGIVYDAVYAIKSTETNADSASVVLAYNYARTDKGYPFSFILTIEWTLTTGNKLSVTSTVTNTNDCSIPFSDGWHPYFNLGNSVNNYWLQFDSNQQLEFNADLLPTGHFITDNRFTEGTLLKGINLDNCFVLNKALANPQCTLSNETLQLRIEPDARYPYLQIYIPDNRQSIAIENLSAAPDAFNNKIGLLELEPYQQNQFSTSYTITLK